MSGVSDCRRLDRTEETCHNWLSQFSSLEIAVITRVLLVSIRTSNVGGEGFSM